MSEEEGKSLSLPKLGAVKKKPVLIIGGAAAAYVLWRYYQASQAGDGAVEGDSDGDGFADAGTIPAVAGQGGPIGDGSGSGKAEDSTDSYGFHGTTNSQWSQYALTQLSASDRWSYTDIAEALGQYIANKPLTSVQQAIVQAAIAVAGQPPEGTHVVVPGGDVPITVKPSKPSAVPGVTTVQLTWPAVPGAASYRIYQDGVKENVGTSVDTTKQVGGLQGSKSYRFAVAAVSAAGKVGPASDWTSVTTKDVSLGKPGTPRVSSVTKSTAKLTWSAVPGADHYLVYINGVAHGSSDDTSYTVVKLRPGTTYKATVKADTVNQGPGPSSGTATFKTKK